VLRPLRERKGHREAATVAATVSPGRKMTGQGPCVSERGLLDGWAGQAESCDRDNSRRRKSFSIFFKFWIWQNFGKLYREILKEFRHGDFS
jgi:hypothetical protein